MSATVRQEDLWRRIGVVPQRAFLFSGTVASNLRYGAPDATDDELWRALEVAQAREFVEAMPDGLDAPITQGGSNVSGGQRQRLAIARAVVRHPDIYLFDDSFCALDFKTDSALRAALREETRSATVVIVAQRVGTIMHADRIVVMEFGSVVGIGTHRELLETCETYREIVFSQLSEAEVGMSGRPTPAGLPAGGPRGPVLGGPGRGPGGPGGMFGGAMLPAAKPKDFRGTFWRLVGKLRPERMRVIAVIVLSAFSVASSVIGPKLLGNATNIVFEGVVGKQIPAGLTQQQAEAGLRASGQGQLADMLSGMTVVPGVGVDFAALAGVLLLVAAVYVVSALFGWAPAYIMAGVAQRTVYKLREEVDLKLARLPLRYFDGHPRGDTLSRVTNDIDNIAQTLQQTMTQAITSVLTVVGVLLIMFTISPLLAVISLLVVPLSAIATTVLIARRSQTQFAAQWARTGDAQRLRRGDAHGPHHRQGLRPPARGDRDVREPRTRSSTRPASGPSSSRGSSSRR